MQFEVAFESIPEDDVIRSEAKVALDTYASLTRLNDLTDRITADPTVTNAQRLILKDEMSEKHFETAFDALNRLSVDARSQIEKESLELFSNNVKLSYEEQTLLQTYAAKFGKNVDPLIDGSEQEARIVLTLIEYFPSIVKSSIGLEHLRYEADQEPPTTPRCPHRDDNGGRNIGKDDP